MLKLFHLWVGLTLGALLSLCALSGGILIYKTSLLERLYPALSFTENSALNRPLNTATVLKQIIERYHSHEITMIHLPDENQRHFQVWLAQGGENSVEYVDPSTAQTVVSRTVDNDWLMWLLEFHSTLLAGETGEQILGLSSFGFIVILMTGLLLWWPGAKRWRRSLLPPRSRRLFAWIHWGHRAIGVIFLPLLITAIFTGIGMVYYTSLQKLLITVIDGGNSLPASKPNFTTCPAEHIATSWESQLERVSNTLPMARLIRIYPPKKANKPVKYRLKHSEEWHQNGRSYVFLNPCNNSVIYQHDARTALRGIRFMNLVYPIHSIHVGGLLYKVLATSLALVPTLLFATGLFFWARRRNSRFKLHKHSRRNSN